MSNTVVQRALLHSKIDIVLHMPPSVMIVKSALVKNISDYGIMVETNSGRTEFYPWSNIISIELLR